MVAVCAFLYADVEFLLSFPDFVAVLSGTTHYTHCFTQLSATWVYNAELIYIIDYSIAPSQFLKASLWFELLYAVPLVVACCVLIVIVSCLPLS